MSNRSPGNAILMAHSSTIAILIRHAMLPVIWFVVTIIAIPTYGDLVSDFGNDKMDLPPITQTVMSISQFTVNHSLLVAFLIVILLAIDAAIYITFLRTQSIATARSWAVIVILAQAVGTALYITAMLLPMVVSTVSIFG